MAPPAPGALIPAEAAAGLTAELIARAPPPPRLRVQAALVYDLEDDELATAALAAVLLGQPLVLAGEPGVGKTQFAAALARRLGLEMQVAFQVKSTTTGRDLLYVFDEVGRFQAEAGTPLCRFVRFNALGRAILLSAGPDAPAALGAVPLAAITGPELAQKLAAHGREPTLGELFPDVFGGTGTAVGRRSCVLIDELDKAPRDAPNDLLLEFDRMAFLIEELDVRVEADPRCWPVVVITSNSERSLPDAFLRRCIFHWIAFPQEERLRRIVAHHCTLAEESAGALDQGHALFEGAVALFEQVRQSAVNKKPATAELIAFVLALRAAGLELDAEPSLRDPRVARLLLTILLKTQVDQDEARRRLIDALRD